MFVDLVESEDVLKAVQARGPMIPMDIRKFLSKGDSITIGAALSTLLSKGMVKSTHVKIGGSPFYYVKGQENKLEILNKYLNDKDKRVFEILRQEKVLKDSVQEPLTRVSLRNISDFAKKVELEFNGETRLYWRWYMIDEGQAINLIRGEVQKRTFSDTSSTPIQRETNQNNISQSNSSHSTQSFREQSSLKEGDESKKKAIKEESLASNNQSSTNSKVISYQKPHDKKLVSSLSEQSTMSEDVDFDDDFFQQIKSFLIENDIQINDAKMIRKSSDYELIVSMKTPFGVTEYFCKAKSKKKCNEGDLSSAYLQGQNKRLPTVFITTGEITKKAKQKAVDEYKGLLIKEL